MFDTLRTKRNGHHFAEDFFKCIFLNENIRISITISLKFIPKCSINNIAALVQIMAWRLPGDELLSDPMMVIVFTYICITRLVWVKCFCCRMIYVFNEYTSVYGNKVLQQSMMEPQAKMVSSTINHCHGLYLWIMNGNQHAIQFRASPHWCIKCHHYRW